MEYSYSFSEDLQQEWHWPGRHGTQPEILRYINHVADRFDLRRDIEFNTRVKTAVFNSDTNTWMVTTDKGGIAIARFCIMATGNLSTPRTPNYPGLERFGGKWYHTGLWPHAGVDFSGLRVGIIGTGSSGVQSIPIIARQAKHLRRKISATVKDAKTAELLCPNDHPIGTKRLILDTDYYVTYNRGNVTLVDIRSRPIEEITSEGLHTADRDYPLDAIVFATGFDAMTGAMKEIDIRTDAGMSVREKWEPGPRTYLGIMMAGFLNLFMITGPQSPGVKSQMILACEQHVDWIADCLQYMRGRGFSRIEAEPAAEDAWVRHNNEVADRTLYPLANSWYVGANIHGKPRVFMPYVGGVTAYKKKCDEIAVNGYEGFSFGAGNEEQRFAAN
jgi:cation diffusion facilitator CzcD-associated flavoprotein CzcO